MKQSNEYNSWGRCLENIEKTGKNFRRYDGTNEEQREIRGVMRVLEKSGKKSKA
ncbi:hypothetical protein [Kiloniella spongiae]|uniref:hypothetical protein n=1 Tax=Kiloniella spongiae TaxID=1489064 RepID=UPI0012E0A9CD|nr:hypothetical protein [Kiloniella spongiae]